MAAPEFAAKFRSKREIYTFLTLDANAYMPPINNVTIYFCLLYTSPSPRDRG